MKLLDPRLWQALTFDDFLFRMSLDPDENGREQNRIRHQNELLAGATFDERAAFFQSVFATPNPLYVLGCDDSHWGGVLDFTNTYARGMRFAFFKFMDGTVPTNYWSTNRPAAIQAGLIVGDYGWLYPNGKVNCKTQAQAMWNRLKDVPKQLPMVIDFEWTYWSGSPAFPNYADLDIWVTEFIRLSGYKPMLYSAAGYMNQFGVMPPALRNKFSHFWFANYGVSKPTLPLGFSEWDLWQFTASLDQTYYAPSSTNKKELDGNYWMGTLYQLQQIAGVVGTDPDNGGTMEFWAKVTTGGLNLRKGIGTSYAVILVMRLGDKVRCSGRKDSTGTWWEIVEHNGTPVLGWACSGGSGGYMKVIAPPTPTEPEEAYLISYDANDNMLERYNKQ
jgi:GH25 family lysozyme M1 (1,4-beta-N-acetylmuramidase)